MGSILGALIGKHLRHQEEARQVDRDMTLTPINDYLKLGAESRYSPDQVRAAIKHGIKAGLVSKNLGITAEAHVAQTEPAWEAAQGQKLLAEQQKTLHDAQQPRGPGMPASPAPAQADGPSAFGPGSEMAGQQSQLTDNHKQQLLQMAAQAQAQAQGGNPFQPMAAPAATQGLTGSPPPGMPPPPVPFGNGAGPAGPAPVPQPNPAAETVAASVKGTIGFGGPAATPPPAPALPKPPRDFWEQDRSPEELAVQKAEAAAKGQIAGARIMAKFGLEQIQNAYARLKAMNIPPEKLTFTQLDSFMEGKGIPEQKGVGTSIPQNAIMLIDTPGGGLQGVMGTRDPIQTAPGATTTKINDPARPGQAFKINPDGPMHNAPAGTPTADTTTISGGPLLARNQQAANAQWEATHAGQKISPANYAEALSAYTEGSMSPTARKLRDVQITNAKELGNMRRLDEAKLTQSIREFNQTRGPEALDSLADQVYQNPDFFQKLTGDVANTVAQRFYQKYKLPAPRPLPADLKNKEDGSIISLNHVAAIKDLIKNPVIQQRMGAWSGRVGDLEQAVGTTVGLSPADAQAIQNFRTRLSYLFAQEGKAVFGGRPPQKMMDDLKKSSPNMKQGMPLFLGAMDAVQGMGELNLKSVNDFRYNKQPGLPGMPPGGMPQMPGSPGAETEAQKIERLARKHQ